MVDKMKFSYKKMNKRLIRWMLLIVLLYLLFDVATLMFDVAIDHPWVYYLGLFVEFAAITGLMLHHAYRTRLYPEFIKFEDDNVKIAYLNKGTFRVNTFKGKREDCVMKRDNDDYIIVSGDKTVAIIKTSEMEEDEIAFLKEKFKYEE